MPIENSLVSERCPISVNTSKIEYACPPGVKWLVEEFYEHEEKIFLNLIQLCGEVQTLETSDFIAIN